MIGTIHTSTRAAADRRPARCRLYSVVNSSHSTPMGATPKYWNFAITTRTSRVVDQRVDRAREAPQRDREHHPAERGAARHAAARARDRGGPIESAGGRKKRGRVHGCWPEHGSSIIQCKALTPKAA